MNMLVMQNMTTQNTRCIKPIKAVAGFTLLELLVVAA